MLIRTGNPEIESLNNFRERHSPLELNAKQHLTSIIDVLRNSRNFRKLLYNCARSLETIALSDVSLKKYVFNILVHQYVSGCIFLKACEKIAKIIILGLCMEIVKKIKHEKFVFRKKN